MVVVTWRAALASAAGRQTVVVTDGNLKKTFMEMGEVGKL
jgi:hypothetical protein